MIFFISIIAQQFAFADIGRVWILLESRKNLKRENACKWRQAPARQVHYPDALTGRFVMWFLFWKTLFGKALTAYVNFF